jgi:hypothetical protein
MGGAVSRWAGGLRVAEGLAMLARQPVVRLLVTEALAAAPRMVL